MSRFEEHEIEALTLIIRKLFMSDIADNVIALETAVTALTAQVNCSGRFRSGYHGSRPFWPKCQA